MLRRPSPATLFLGLLAALSVVGVRQEQGSPLTAGTDAPSIRLNDQDGRAVAVFPPPEGTWTILAFYPKAATPG